MIVKKFWDFKGNFVTRKPRKKRGVSIKKEGFVESYKSLHSESVKIEVLNR